MTTMIVLLLFWVLKQLVPEKKYPGYTIAPTDKERKEELGI